MKVSVQIMLKELDKKGKDAIRRLKSRGLIVPVKAGMKYYKYDMTNLGLTTLKKLEENKDIPKIPTKRIN